MRLVLLLLALLAGSCATAGVVPGASYVAEDVRHVVTMREFDSSAEAEAAVQSLRTQPGNLVVLLLRRDGRLLVIAEWRTAGDAQRGGILGQQFDVLFEAAEFDKGEE